MFLCQRKNRIFVKKYQMCFVIKNWIFKEDQICFYVKERIRFLLKSTNVFCEKLKKKINK